MSKVRIELATGNSAFTPEINNEVARILRSLADKIMDESFMIAPFPLKDINGNTVGYLEIIRQTQQAKRAEEIVDELKEGVPNLLTSAYEDGGRTPYYEVNFETLDYITGLLQELDDMKGKRIYG